MPPQDLLQMCDDRIQRALLMIWRGPPFKPRMRLVPDVLLDRLDQTRLADPRLATQEHHLSLPVFDLEPPFEQELTSCSRPTSGVRPLPTATSRRLWASLPCKTRNTLVGVATPLSACRPRS